LRRQWLEVEATGQRGPMTTGSDRNGFDLIKLTSSLSPQRWQTELWLLLNTKTKS